jgi:hypothetical protein
VNRFIDLTDHVEGVCLRHLLPLTMLLDFAPWDSPSVEQSVSFSNPAVNSVMQVGGLVGSSYRCSEKDLVSRAVRQRIVQTPLTGRSRATTLRVRRHEHPIATWRHPASTDRM